MKKLIQSIYVQAKMQRAMAFALVIILCAAISMMCGCSRKVVTQAVTNERTDTIYVARHDTLRDLRLRVDSIVERDSIVTVIRGDTVMTDRWHTRYRDRLRVDTVERVRWRTVYRTQTVTLKIAEKEASTPPWWQRWLMWVGVVELVRLLIWGGVRIVRYCKSI